MTDKTSTPQSRPAGRMAAEDADLFWPGLAVAAGALGVVVTSIFYALAPPRAALPMPEPVLVDVLPEMLNGQAFMVAAGTVGVVSDVIFAAGALALMVLRRPSRSHFAQLGWAFVAISNLIFVTVDGLASGVLTRLASLEGAYATFAGFKLLFDVLFIAGTLAFGFGGIALLLGEVREKVPVLPRALLWIGVAVSLAGLASSLLYFASINLAPAIGISIAAGAIVFSVYGVQISRSSRR